MFHTGISDLPGVSRLSCVAPRKCHTTLVLDELQYLGEMGRIVRIKGHRNQVKNLFPEANCQSYTSNLEKSTWTLTGHLDVAIIVIIEF